LVAAARTGTADPGTFVFTAASAFVEKGQSEKAFAALGSNMLKARTASPDMRNFGLKFIGEQGFAVVLPNTKMA
jgi:hypothetical protein